MALSLNPIKVFLAPYAIYFKLALLAALFIGGVFTGCKCQATRNDAQVIDLTKWRDYYKEQANVNADAIREVNRQAKANQQAAFEWRDRAEEASNTAARERRANEQLKEDFAEKLARAKKDPDCKAIMEMELCPALRDY